MQNKLWFDEDHLRFSDQRKQAKMQWLQDPTQSNIENLCNVRRETSRHTRNKRNEFLKAKVDELETNSQIKNIGDLYRGLRRVTIITNIVTDEKGDLLTDTHSILPGWRNHFPQLLKRIYYREVVAS